MHQAGDAPLKLRLHRHHEPVGTDGDDGLLEVFCGGGGDNALEHLPRLAGGDPNLSAQVGKLCAGVVGDLILGQNGAADLLLQILIRGQALEDAVDTGLFLSHAAVGRHVSGGAQDGGDLQ